MHHLQTYQPNTQAMQQYQQEQQEKSANREKSDICWWSIPHGMSSVRILPPWDPTGRVGLPVHSHRIQYKDDTMKFTKYEWTCLNKTFGQECEICRSLEMLSQTGVKVDDYGPWSKKYYFNAIVMHDPIYEKEIQMGKKPEDIPGVPPGTHVLMKAPKVVYDWIVSQIVNPMIGDITNLQTGIDVLITKEGSGLNTKYNCTLSPNGRAPVPEAYLNNIQGLHNLDDIFKPGPDEELTKKMIAGLQGSAGVLGNGAAQNVSNQMAGIPGTPQIPGVPAPGFGGGIPQVPNVPVAPPVPQAPNVPTPPVPAPPVPTPPAPPVAPPPQEHIDAAGNKYHLINNQWVMVQPAQPTPPPAPPAVPTPPQSPPAQPAVAPAPPTPPASQPASPPPAPPTPAQAPASAPIPGAPASAPADDTSKKPACFGQYNPAQVNCVVCPHEIPCNQATQR